MMFKIGSAVVGIMLMASSVSFAQNQQLTLSNIAPSYDVPQLDAKQLKCMVLNLYHEARSESEKGMIAVGYVTLNRVVSNHFPDSICKVVKQAVYYKNGMPKRNKCQFSWWCDGKDDKADEMFELQARIIKLSFKVHELDNRLVQLERAYNAKSKHTQKEYNNYRKATRHIKRLKVKLNDRIINLRGRLNVWLRALKLAEKVILNEVADPTHGALYYHADYVHPKWAKIFKKTATIDTHIFYVATR